MSKNYLCALSGMGSNTAETSRHIYMVSRVLIALTTFGSVLTIAPMAQAQLTTCAYGELFEFNNSNSIVFTADPSNSDLFTAQSIQNDNTFDFTVLNQSPPTNPLTTPISGTHNQSGGTATDGGILILASKNGVGAADITVDISGGFVTELEFYGHDIEDNESIIFGALDYVANSLIAHPGATINIDEPTRTLSGAAGNTNGQSNRSGFGHYSNINGLTSLTQITQTPSGRLGLGFALGSYCVSIIDAQPEAFADVNGTVGGATASVLTSDTLNGALVVPAEVNLIPGDITGPDGSPSGAITLNANGTIIVPAGTPAGDYTVEYEICDNINAANCSAVTETVTVIGPALLDASKTVEMFSTTGNAAYALPGSDVIYTITVKNIGAGSVTNDSVELIDNMPPEITFWNGDIDAGGPDNFTDNTPVAFEQPAATGLTFNYNTDVRFGFGPTAPTDFNSCTAVTPDNTYRDDFEYICFNPKGILTASFPNATFSMNFRAKIK